jgi:hypothetical protein
MWIICGIFPSQLRRAQSIFFQSQLSLAERQFIIWQGTYPREGIFGAIESRASRGGRE